MIVRVSVNKYSKANLTASKELLNVLSFYLGNVDKNKKYAEDAYIIAEEIYEALKEDGYY